VTSLFILQGTAGYLTSILQERMDISVYFKEGLTEEDILEVKDELTQLPEVKEIEYVSKEDALLTFSKRHQDDIVIMESLAEVGGNPFFASLNVRAFEASQYAAISTLLDAAPFNDLITRVDYFEKKPVIERFSSITSSAYQTGLVFSLILGIIAFLLAFNQVRMAIYSSKEEIEVMRLVGASNWFIQGPFLIQGIIAGFLAALITFLIFSISLFFLAPNLENILAGFNMFTFITDNLGILFLIQIVTGVGLGVLSSFIAIRKYLKV
jgi:cell division transport system permease protein